MKPRYSEQQVNEVIRLRLEEKLSIKEIREKTGVSRIGIYYLLKGHGIKIDKEEVKASFQ